jgi:hypothetical protein
VTLKRILRGLQRRTLAPLLNAAHNAETIAHKTLILNGALLANALRTREHLHHLSDAAFSVYSQWGEDGILEWLIQRLPISSNRFIEFGVEDYSEANTRFLLVNRNWKGLVMDASEENIGRLRSEAILWRHDLTAKAAFIDRESINGLIQRNGFNGKLGVLSIDVDGNDYWIWEAINTVDPDIVVCEYNAVFGDRVPVTIPYAADFVRHLAHSSFLYYGASIAALRMLAQRKGYTLIGSNLEGVNAFFIRTNLYQIIAPHLSTFEARPSLVRESRDQSRSFTFASGENRLQIISNMPVIELETRKTVLLRELGDLYSAEWRSRYSLDSTNEEEAARWK